MTQHTDGQLALNVPTPPAGDDLEALLARIPDTELTADDLHKYGTPTPARPAVRPADTDLKVHNNTTLSFVELVKVFTAAGAEEITVRSLRGVKDRWGPEGSDTNLLGFPVTVRNLLLARVLVEVARHTPLPHSALVERIPTDILIARDNDIADACHGIWDTPRDDVDARVLVLAGTRVIVLNTLADLPIHLQASLTSSTLMLPVGAWATTLRDVMDTYVPPRKRR